MRRGWLPVIFTILGLFIAGGVGRSSVLHTPSVAAAGSTTLIVHYHRFNGNYGNTADVNKSWNVWVWGVTPAVDGNAYRFDDEDAFGRVAHIQVPCSCTRLGFIVRLGNWVLKDVDQDRFVDTPTGQAEIWLIQDDPNIYTSEATASAAIDAFTSPLPTPHNAFLDASTQADVALYHAVDLSKAQPSDFVVTDLTTGKTIAVTDIAAAVGTTIASTDRVTLSLASAPNVTDKLQVTYIGRPAASLVPRLVLTGPQYTYNGSDLGAVYSKRATTFRIWAPLATKVVLHLYKNEAGKSLKTVTLRKSTGGTWLLKVKGNLKNVYYLYDVTNFGSTQPVLDPYTKGVATDGKYAQIVDLTSTNPKGWKSDHYVTLAHQTDASIYEVHVRDFSIDANSGIKHPGKYLAFTEIGTKGPGGVATGVSSLKELGITHVELLPIQFSSDFKEAAAESTNSAPADGSLYNWNYNPTLWEVPTAAYATTPHGTARITEVKQMVQALHKQHIGVILDVVYAHTYGSFFENLVPGYYYRTTDTGSNPNATGLGTDVAAERPMVRKLILDSLEYWMRQYHVDGFRFDQMALLGTQTMTDAAQMLRAIDPSAVLLGEGFGYPDAGIIGDTEFSAGKQAGTHIGNFNLNEANAVDRYLGAPTDTGYATGDPRQASAVVGGVTGSIDYAGKGNSFAQNPDESINFVSLHDRYALWDRLLQDETAPDDATRIKMDELAQAVTFTSQGVPFMEGGAELLHTRGGSENAVTAGDAVNELDWSRKSQYPDVFSYYAGLIHLRNAHSAFRMDDPAEVRSHLTFLDSPQNSIEYELTGNANGDSWKTIVVIYNPNNSAITATLPAGSWTIAATQGKIGVNPLGTATGTVSVPDYSMMVLYQ